MITSHKLHFEVAEWGLSPEWMRFKVGTVHGLWHSTPDHYEILSLVNKEPGNGHFDDVLEWFEASCKRDGKNLRIAEIWNERFLNHLVKKRGFIEEVVQGSTFTSVNAVKIFI